MSGGINTTCTPENLKQLQIVTQQTLPSISSKQGVRSWHLFRDLSLIFAVCHNHVAPIVWPLFACRSTDSGDLSTQGSEHSTAISTRPKMTTGHWTLSRVTHFLSNNGISSWLCYLAFTENQTPPKKSFMLVIHSG